MQVNPEDHPPDIYVTWSNPRMTNFENDQPVNHRGVDDNRDVENFFSMSDIRSDKLRKFVRPNENMPDRIYILHNSTPFFQSIAKYLAWCSIT